jgi:hypothetical protein
MTTGSEFYDPSGRLLFSSLYSPFVYAGKVDVPANAGFPLQSRANQEDSRSPNLVGVESCTVQCPANSTFVAVSGDKCPVGISIYLNTGNGLWYCSFWASSGSTCTLYFFKKHPGTSTTNQGLEFYDTSGKVMFDVGSSPIELKSPLVKSMP